MSILYHQRLDDILEFLINQNSPVSLKKMITLFEVTDRTIRNDIKTINDILQSVDAKISLIRSVGYQLDINNSNDFFSWWNNLKEKQSGISTVTNEERRQTLLYLLLTQSEPETLDTILDKLYVGKNTFYSYLKFIRNLLLPFNLKIVNRPNIGFEIVGSEFNKRQAISELLIKKDLHDYLIDFTPIEISLFDNIDLVKLKMIELNRLAPLSLLDSDYFHKNVLSSLALAVSRNKSGYIIGEIPYIIPKLKQEILTTLNYFFDEIEEKFDIDLDKNEKDYFFYILSINFPRLVINAESSEDNTLIAENITNDFLKEIKKSSSYDWTSDFTLRKDLSSHIQGLINMDFFRNDRINPMLETIKSAFPLAFDLSLTHIEKIAPKYNFYFSEDEIGYIALHLAGAIERNEKESVKKLKVAIVCGSGKTLSKLIEMKLIRRFGNKIDVIGKYSYAEIQKNISIETDIIVTTISFIKKDSNIIFIDINNLDRDINKIHTYINSIENNFQSITSQLFINNHFYYINDVLSKEELINIMVNNLIKDNYVNQDFLPSVMEREALGQTNFSNILAIPHPMSLIALKSVIPIAIVPDGIDWGNGQSVKFVFLSCITKNDYENTDYFYDLILDLMSQSEKQDQILRNPTFDNFMQTINKLDTYI